MRARRALAIVACTVVIGCGTSPAPDSPSPEAASTPVPSPTAAAVAGPTVVIGAVAFPAEVAVSREERLMGLSGREALSPGTGLLYVFEPGAAPAFWMKGMRFPLDFIWISEECTVVDITHDVPAPDPTTPTTELPTYGPSSPAAYNFEINAGEAVANGMTAGAPVRFSGLPEGTAAGCQ